MIDIAQWLIYVEHLAGSLYDDASTRFTDDKELSTFLKQLAIDEADHYHEMGKAAEFIRRESIDFSHISVDDHTKDGIETPFKRNIRLLENGEISKESILECVVTTEFSEWNHIYLYVVNTLKFRSREFMPVASRMQRHLSEIKEFIQRIDDSADGVKKLLRLPTVWENKILIVEDDPPIVDLLTAILEEEGSIEVALNGEQGLEKTVNSHYDVIISDINMPIMNGIEFIKKASVHDNDILKRVIFFTSTDISEHKDFIEQNSITVLQKPASLQAIKTVVTNIFKTLRK
jgi:two-component system chemotaxis response regulator CheY